jgi:hypothetical protein
MARKRISLSQFEIEGPVLDGESACLRHRHRNCNWRQEADCMTPMELVRAARDHAKECDGKPLPEQSAASGFLVPAALPEQLMAALTAGAVRPDAGLEAYLAEFAARTT